MVTFCQEPVKLCVGTKTGVLALYDLKTSRYQVGRKFICKSSRNCSYYFLSHSKLIQRMKS